MHQQLFFFIAVLFCLPGCSNAQTTPAISAIGQYEQQVLSGPDTIQSYGGEVAIRQDGTSAKVIWIDQLLPGGSIRAVQTMKNETLIYTIPPQKIGGYQISIGCVVYDGEDGRLVVALNNKSACKYMSQGDYGDVSVGKNKVKAGDVEINGDGKGQVKTDHVEIKDGEIKVDAKAIMAGVQYVGQKMGMKSPDEDDDKEEEEEEKEKN